MEATWHLPKLDKGFVEATWQVAHDRHMALSKVEGLNPDRGKTRKIKKMGRTATAGEEERGWGQERGGERKAGGGHTTDRHATVPNRDCFCSLVLNWAVASCLFCTFLSSVYCGPLYVSVGGVVAFRI